MKIKELKIKTNQELEMILKETKEKLRKLKFEAAGKKLKNIHEVSDARKTIAKILTIMKERKA